MMNRKSILSIAFSFVALLGWGANKVTCYTSSVGGQSLERSQLSLTKVKTMSSLILNPTQTFQEMDGFGAAITYSAAYNLQKMAPADRKRFLEETYSEKKGFGFSYIRTSIGCSDFSSTEYTCLEQPGLDHFKLFSDETDYVIPILKEILKISPHIKIIAAPWTCPRWMKVKDLETLVPLNSWTDGHINPRYYQDYADYFVRWIRTFEAEGIPIYAVTPQNEPLNPGNCASTVVTWQEEAELVKVMATTFKREGLKTKIYTFDHNYNYDNKSDQRNYPVKIYNQLGNFEGSEYVVGAAYHNYGGHPEELNRIHDQYPEKELIFSEASIGTWNHGRELEKSLLRDVNELSLATVNRWCRAVVVWNLMLDLNRGPNLDGGCQTCYGAVDIDQKDYKTIHRNSHYYAIAHLSSIVKPGAHRIGLLKEAKMNGIHYAAFQNPDKTLALLITNTSDQKQTLIVEAKGQQFQCQVPAQGVVSCRW